MHRPRAGAAHISRPAFPAEAITRLRYREEPGPFYLVFVLHGRWERSRACDAP